ncbi:hypothetical protein [Microbulbifer sp. GL-2]|uniref:hypothetical protein n=1 Tax=Microbulbifer sp. GL-2 TaxID=2591606 RepID=UPI0011628962|nr:hypothetical protein [Microbulbifer sp. GL-2]BBM04049.1 hypothetical protein GL2_41230 [Microbulbifer sp. GL-2]
MPSYENFLSLLDNDLEQAFKTYELDFNSAEFDSQAGAYETSIEFEFKGPNKILMKKDPKSDKKATYLTWARKKAVPVKLDSNSPPYFMTSHLSNCRMTFKFHDDQNKSVTVIHVAGDVPNGGTIEGSVQRDELENEVVTPEVKRTRRLSIGGPKTGQKGRNFKKEQAKAGTAYYDTCARVFGVRGDDDRWTFYTQDIGRKDKLIGFFEIE